MITIHQAAEIARDYASDQDVACDVFKLLPIPSVTPEIIEFLDVPAWFPGRNPDLFCFEESGRVFMQPVVKSALLSRFPKSGYNTIADALEMLSSIDIKKMCNEEALQFSLDFLSMFPDLEFFNIAAGQKAEAVAVKAQMRGFSNLLISLLSLPLDMSKADSVMLALDLTEMLSLSEKVLASANKTGAVLFGLQVAVQLVSNNLLAHSDDMQSVASTFWGFVFTSSLFVGSFDWFFNDLFAYGVPASLLLGNLHFSEVPEYADLFERVQQFLFSKVSEQA